MGGSVLLPLIPQYLELTGSVLYGRGVGRYAAGQLPDVTIAPDGSLSLVTGLSAMVGLVAHPWEGLDVYAYAGMEQVNSNFFNIGATLFGLGNPGFSNATCLITTPFSFSGNTPADCIANNKRLSDVTVGFWQNVYKGDYGRVAFGAQYEYIKRKAFVWRVSQHPAAVASGGIGVGHHNWHPETAKMLGSRALNLLAQ